MFLQNVIFRQATENDMSQVFELIEELAKFEKMPSEVINSVEGLIEDGFGKNPLFGCLVAEFQHKIIGISVFYYRYSTWKRKRLYLEDIIVTENFRGKGVGKKLFELTIQEAKLQNCTGLQLQVLDWNKSAIQFYENYQLQIDKSWYNASLNF